MKKRVILMGAGAAYLYGGPSCDDLTKYLIKEVPICVDLHKALTDYYGADNCNFETILAAIEHLLYSTEHHTSDKLVYTDTIIPVLYSCKFNYSEAELKEAYQSSINIIIAKIEAYSNDRSEIVDSLLFNYLNDNNYSTKIYTLNYDRIIPLIYESKEIAYIDGTNGHGAFKCSIEEFVNHKYSYFNLHGNIYLKQNPWMLYDVSQDQNVQYLTTMREQEGGNPHNKTYFSPIISGYSKTQRLLSQPFSYGMACFAQDLQECSHIDIIGYSFSDPHINSMLKSFGQLRDKHVNIVDYITRDDNTEFKIEEIAKDLSWYYKQLSDNWKREGDAYLFATHRLMIYINGFENYLKSL